MSQLQRGKNYGMEQCHLMSHAEGKESKNRSKKYQNVQAKLVLFRLLFSRVKFQVVSVSFESPIFFIFWGFGFRLVSDWSQFRIGKDSRKFPSFAGHYF
jgi:hypothetical protein